MAQSQTYTPYYGYSFGEVVSAARFLATDYYSAERWLREQDRKQDDSHLPDGCYLGQSSHQLSTHSATSEFYADRDVYSEGSN